MIRDNEQALRIENASLRRRVAALEAAIFDATRQRRPPDELLKVYSDSGVLNKPEPEPSELLPTTSDEDLIASLYEHVKVRALADKDPRIAAHLFGNGAARKDERRRPRAAAPAVPAARKSKSKRKPRR
jgi:hypothetical protein